MSHEKNREHYDSVVESWQVFMGENFHWGYFGDASWDLDQATIGLIDLMAGMIEIKSGAHVLDVGCGIGGPASYLNERFGCSVTGISNSPAGIAEATQRASARGSDSKLRFLVRDALSNGFEAGSFDIVWLMEMSHLIQNKQALIGEAARSVKPGGQVALCDLTFNRRPLPMEIFRHIDDHKLLKRAFGEAQLETLATYRSLFENAGLVEIEILDISREVAPTLVHWKHNAENWAIGRSAVESAAASDFAKSCDILARFYAEGTWGYGCIAGRRLS